MTKISICPTRSFSVQQSRQAMASQSLKVAAGDSRLLETVKELINLSDDEARKIHALAKQLGGDPYRATEYVEAVELNRQLHDLYTLLRGNATYNIPAPAMESAD
jgi:hypothetical protein